MNPLRIPSIHHPARNIFLFDAKADAALIEALQQTVWSVVAGHPHSGVKKT